MKKFSVIFFALILALFCAACGSTTADDEEEEGNKTDTGDTSDTGDTVDTGDTDTGDTGEDTGEGVITKIQRGDIKEGTTVTTECVVTGIQYEQDNETHENTAIKGLYVSELIEKAQPYSGIYVFIKETAGVNDYEVGDKLEVKGTYKEYYENSQIEAAKITKFEKAELPEPAEISDSASIATLFEVNGQDEKGHDTFGPTANHGADAEQYEGVLVKVTDVEITNQYIGHGNFEVDGSLVVTKTLFYYGGDRSKGKKFKSITGILLYEYDAFRLAPRSEEDFEEDEDSSDTGDSDTGDTDTGDTVVSATIKDIQSSTSDEKTLVEIKNAVVISPVIEYSYGYSFYVSDGTTGDYSGLYIYKVKSDTKIEKGDEVTIKGLAQKYSGQWEVQGVDNANLITKTGTGTVPALVKKAYADIKDSDKGTYLEITDELTVDSVDEFNNVTFTNGMLIMPFVDKDTVKYSLKAGDKCTVSGIYDVSHKKEAIIIVDANDIKKK